MNKNTWEFLIMGGIFFISVILSGCQVIVSPIIYQPTPTKVSYEISYGYLLNATGNARYEITYWCNIPEVLNGTITYDLLYNHDYQKKTRANNTFILWNLSKNDEQTYKLGITAQVQSKSYVVTDLGGKNALTIKEIKEKYSEIVKHYTRLQANETIRFIDPDDPNINTLAKGIHINAKTNNSFLVAKALFVWLKKNIQYQSHPYDNGVQSAAVTLYKNAGDCDDLSFLYISLCRAVGIPARFIQGYLLNNIGNDKAIAIAHAWVEVFVGEFLGNNGWIPVECACCTTSIETDIHQNFGVETAFHLRLFTDDGSNESLTSVISGISYVTYGLDINIESPLLISEVRNYQELESKKLVITKEKIRFYE